MTGKSEMNAVCFIDERLENIHFEQSALRRKLQSKVEALTIMSKELDTCRGERDQFKLMAEQIQYRYSSLKKTTYRENTGSFSDVLDYNQDIGTSIKMMNDLREQNKVLTLEVETLKQKLFDTDGDIRVLRRRFVSQKPTERIIENYTPFPSQGREDLINQLEFLNNKIRQMKSDLRTILDEKEELITERDAFKCKAHRLNHELKVLLTHDKAETHILDIDALIMENKYLNDRLTQTESEKELANQTLAKYKCMLESKRKKGMVKLGSNSTDLIMSHKQVKQLLEQGTLSEMPVAASTIADLKSLCLGMLEAFNDKSLALSHQRKANKILASRITKLEQRLETVGGVSLKMTVFPSQILLNDYQSSEVDNEVILPIDEVGSDSRINKSDVSKEDISTPLPIINTVHLEKLPPELENLVQKAVEDIKLENSLQSK